MKLKIAITGPKVHEVGYRVFLGKLAMSLGMPGFMAYNWDYEGQQQVIALAEGDEARISIFRKRVEERMPKLAEVSAINFDDKYDGDVGKTSEFAMLLSFEQFDKAIPILLDMREDLKAVRKNTDTIPLMAKNTEETLEEVRGLRDDLTHNTNRRLEGIERDMRTVKTKLGIR